MTTWLNTPFRMRFRVIDGLTVRFARSEHRGDHAPLLSPWPESLLAFEGRSLTCLLLAAWRAPLRTPR